MNYDFDIPEIGGVPGEEAIERLIDRIGLGRFLRVVAGVCYDKADHIRESYQDDVTAQTWDAMAGIVAIAAGDIETL